MKFIKKTYFLVLALCFIALILLQFLSIRDEIQSKSSRLSLQQRQIVFEAKSLKVLNDAVNPIRKKAGEIAEAPATEKSVDEKDKIIEVKEEKKAVDYSSANLAIVVTEAGGKREDLQYAASKLPVEVAIAFNPYSDELKIKMDDMIKAGREVLLNLMFEPSNFPISDTGPLTIQGYLDDAQKAIKLQEAFTKALGVPFKGVLSNSDEILTHNFENITPVLKILKNKEYFFGYFRKPVNANLENDVKPLALDIFVVDYLIDDKGTKDSITTKLDEIYEELKNPKKKLVIALRPNRFSVKFLSKWLAESDPERVRIAPISYFVTDN